MNITVSAAVAAARLGGWGFSGAWSDLRDAPQAPMVLLSAERPHSDHRVRFYIVLGGGRVEIEEDDYHTTLRALHEAKLRPRLKLRFELTDTVNDAQHRQLLRSIRVAQAHGDDALLDLAAQWDAAGLPNYAALALDCADGTDPADKPMPFAVGA